MNTKEIISEADIYSAKINKNTTWIFINLRLANGNNGWGEATLNKKEKLIYELAKNKLPQLVGLSLDELSLKLKVEYTIENIPNAVLYSAINSAFVDLVAKNKKISLANEIGIPRNSEVELYANFNRRTLDRSLKGVKKSIQFVKDNGFNAYKFAPFDEVFPSQSKSDFYRSLTIGLERIEVIKNIIEKGAKLMIDCHWRFQEQFIDILINELLQFDIYWLECPILENVKSIKDIKNIRNKINKYGIKLAGLETCISKNHFEPFLKEGCYDIVMPDVKYVGGPIKMLEIANFINMYGAEFSPHNPSGPICHAHSIQVCSVIDTPVILEHQFDETPFFNILVSNNLPQIKNGKISLRDKPGIGVQIDKNLDIFKHKNIFEKKNKNVFDKIAELSLSEYTNKNFK